MSWQREKRSNTCQCTGNDSVFAVLTWTDEQRNIFKLRGWKSINYWTSIPCNCPYLLVRHDQVIWSKIERSEIKILLFTSLKLSALNKQKCIAWESAIIETLLPLQKRKFDFLETMVTNILLSNQVICPCIIFTDIF